jgi:hypothetical protein
MLFKRCLFLPRFTFSVIEAVMGPVLARKAAPVHPPQPCPPPRSPTSLPSPHARCLGLCPVTARPTSLRSPFLPAHCQHSPPSSRQYPVAAADANAARGAAADDAAVGNKAADGRAADGQAASGTAEDGKAVDVGQTAVLWRPAPRAWPASLGAHLRELLARARFPRAGSRGVLRPGGPMGYTMGGAAVVSVSGSEEGTAAAVIAFAQLRPLPVADGSGVGGDEAAAGGGLLPARAPLAP